jgi:hypothetical protein
MVDQCVEDKANVLQVLGLRQAVDQSVVKEDEHKPVEEGPENIIHEHLECGWRIGETEGHDVQNTIFSMSYGCIRS